MTPNNTDSGSQIASAQEQSSGSVGVSASASVSVSALDCSASLYSDLSRIHRSSGMNVAQSTKRDSGAGAAKDVSDRVVCGDYEFITALEQLKAEEADLVGERYLQFVFTDDDRAIALDKDLFGDGLRRDNNRETMMLELLLVFSCQDRNLPFDQAQKDQYGRVVYLKRRQHLLRRIIFNNPFLQTVLNANVSNEQKWREWRRLFINFNAYTRHSDPVKADSDNNLDIDLDADASVETSTATNASSKQTKVFGYNDEELRSLEAAFPTFDSFVQAVNLMRSWSLNFEADNQWVYKYLFPSGYETLFCEIRSTYDAAAGLDYIRQSSNYMSGCGDFVFSMLQRACAQTYERNTESASVPPQPYQVDAKKAQFIASALRRIFFRDNNPINALAEILSCKRSQYERELMYKLQEPQQDFAHKANILGELQLEPSYQDGAHKANLAVTRMLSVKNHRVFKQLAEEYYNVLHLNLSVQDQFTTLGTIGMLNLMVFLMEIGQGALGVAQKQSTAEYNDPDFGSDATSVTKPCNIDMIVSIKASKRTRLHQMSQQRLRVNQSLIKDCLVPYAMAHATTMMRKLAPEFITRLNLDPHELRYCESVLKRLFTCNANVDLVASLKEKTNTSSYATDEAVNSTPKSVCFNDLLNSLKHLIEQNSSTFVEVHQRFGRSIGLIPSIAARGNAQSYYSFTDEIVRILVYSVLGIKRHMLFEEFLKQLHARYHIVIGPYEARRYYQTDRKDPNFIEQKEFADNANEFKEQLRRLDLLLSLSDGFDYVCNPYGQA